MLRLVTKSENLTHLAPQDCISAYATDFVSKYNSVVLISPGFNGSDLPMTNIATQTVKRPSIYSPDPPYSWTCIEDKYRGNIPDDAWSKLCSDVHSRARSRQDWIVRGHKVDYCLAEETTEKCSLEYSLPLAIIVISANLTKAILIYLIACLLRGDPLLTVGDAVASFLRSPDSSTAEACLLTRKMVSSDTRSGIQEQKYSILGKDPVYEPRPYIAKQERWWSSLSRARWASFFSVYVTLPKPAIYS